jgi:FixJ family two-component response regulator
MVQDLHPQVAMLLCAETVDNDAPVRAQENGAVGLLWKPLDLWRMRSAIQLAHEIAVERLLLASHYCRGGRMRQMGDNCE